MSGLSSKALAFGTPENKLKYNGKEEQKAEFSDGSGLDWLDYGARMYDYQVGRWHVVDAKTELFYSMSAYVNCLNNPVKYFDPEGNEPESGIKPKYEKFTNQQVADAAYKLGFNSRELKKGEHHVTANGLGYIASYEGLSLSMYDLDGNGKNASIGFGYLIHRGAIDGRDSEKPFKDGISFDKAVDLFTKGAVEHEGYVNTYLIKYGLGESLKGGQFAALVDLSFNKGPDDALAVIKILAEKGTDAAADYIRGLNKGNKGLQLRRYFESELFQKGRALTQEQAREELKKQEEEKKINQKRINLNQI